MIFETDKIKRIALDVSNYLNEYKLGEAYVDSICEVVSVGDRIPGIEEVMDNHRMRDNLACFLLYRSSLISEEASKQGMRLADRIDSIGAVREVDKLGDKAGLAWDLCDVMKKTDIFYFLDAGYAKAGDNQSDPVRRIYRDIENREKCQDIIDYLEIVLKKDIGDGNRIQNIISSLENSADKAPIRPGKAR